MFFHLNVESNTSSMLKSSFSWTSPFKVLSDKIGFFQKGMHFGERNRYNSLDFFSREINYWNCSAQRKKYLVNYLITLQVDILLHYVSDNVAFCNRLKQDSLPAACLSEGFILHSFSTKPHPSLPLPPRNPNPIRTHTYVHTEWQTYIHTCTYTYRKAHTHVYTYKYMYSQTKIGDIHTERHTNAYNFEH